jgi:hypothetical protein
MLLLRAFSTGVFQHLPHINIGVGVWGESSIMTGVYQHWWFFSTFWDRIWAE